MHFAVSNSLTHAGRSIRHQKDYSTILLVDHRYSSPAVRSRLPEWIQKRVQPPTSFGKRERLASQYQAHVQPALHRHMTTPCGLPTQQTPTLLLCEASATDQSSRWEDRGSTS
ncbi:ATP-dependent helicase, C-terminal [Phytophthora cactorum]|nr:ATP-dependent helicase, C-terminal [Phytophthora cactorum]